MAEWKFSYEGCSDEDVEQIGLLKDNDTNQIYYPIKYNLQKPKDKEGNFRDQTTDAANNMRYAHSLGLVEHKERSTPRMGRAIICGGAPSIKNHLEEIRKLASDHENWVFAINWTHTWLIDNGIVPKGCVFFEIDAEPDTVLKRAHPEVTYFICSHCSPQTFDALKDFKRVLWHSPPNSEPEKVVREELFSASDIVGGGVGTFTRTMTLALQMGFRNIELFGVDGSFPDDSDSTHVEGYQTTNNVQTDAFYVLAKPLNTDDPAKIRRFKTVGYLALQHDEFQEYCRVNHMHFACRVHGDGLLRFTHQNNYPDQYNY